MKCALQARAGCPDLGAWSVHGAVGAFDRLSSWAGKVLMYFDASFKVDERVKEAPRGDREIIVENVDSECPRLPF